MYFKEIKRLKSLLQKAEEAYLEPKRATTLNLFVNIPNDLLFSKQKLHQRFSIRLYKNLRKYWNFQSEAKVEQITAIGTKCSVSCLNWNLFQFILRSKFYYFH